jgi:hypothetical protein
MLQHLTLHDHHLMIMDCLSNSMLDLLDTQIMLTSITLHIYQLLCKMLVIGENLGHCNWWNPKVLLDSQIFFWMNMTTISWKNILGCPKVPCLTLLETTPICFQQKHKELYGCPFVLTSWTIYQVERKVNNHHKSWYIFPLCQNRFKIDSK